MFNLAHPAALAIQALIVLFLAISYGYKQDQIPLGATRTPPTTYCYRQIQTEDDERPRARCFEVTDGIFTKVYTEDEPVPENAILDSNGFAMPGLWDGHGHLMQYGQFLHSVDLFGAQSLEDVRLRLKAYLVANPGAGTRDSWVRGIGWDQTAFGRMPTAADLTPDDDDELRGVYAMVDRIDVHCTLVSQAVLNLLPPDLPDVVDGGEIVRDPGPGVFCDNAMNIVMARFPPPSEATRRGFVGTAMSTLNGLGIVGMHDAGATPEELAMYADMTESEPDSWSVRVYAMAECPQRNTFCADQLTKIVRDDGMFTMRSVKLFADGALGSWGSAMIEPYTDRPDTSGSLLVNSSTLTQLARSWSAAGFQVNIHAIGDLANRYAMDAMEASLNDLCPTSPPDLAVCQAGHRFRIEHSQIIHPLDQARMRAMRLIPSIQPTHATSDMKYAEDRLGRERTANSAYRMRSIIDLAPILGSDFPVEPPNPFRGIFAAVTRRDPHTGEGHGWHVEEALTVKEAVRGFTGNVAYGGFMEGRAGVIREGAMADWLVLEKGLEEMTVDEIRETRVRETWVGGRRVYQVDAP